MSRTLLICLAVMTAAITTAFAQITLTSESFPEVGGSFTHRDVGSVAVNLGSPGGNQTWTIPDHGGWDTSTESFVAPSSTPFAGDFPAATHASTEDNTLWQYYRLAGNGVFYQGMGGEVDGFDTLVVFNPEVSFVPLPLTYGTQWSSVWHMQYEYEISPGNFVTVFVTDSTRHNTDAWGTLNTPFGSWQVLRVQDHHYTMITTDPPVFSQTMELYGYTFATNSGFQGATMRQPDDDDAPNPSFTTGDVNVRTYNPTSAEPARGPVAERFAVGQNYPNPFNPSTMLPVELQHDATVTLAVYDETGRLVSSNEMQLPAGAHQLPIDGSQWATGTYFARVSAGEQMLTTKMQLVK